MTDTVIVREVQREVVRIVAPDSRELIRADSPLARETVKVIAEGPRGATGPEGPRGATGDGTFDVVAASAIGGHRAVIVSADGAASYASNTFAAHAFSVAGLTLNAAAPGGTLTVVRMGRVVEPSWSWIQEQPIFLGIGGLLTQTPPVAPAVFSLVLGFPLSPTEIFFNLHEPINLGL